VLLWMGGVTGKCFFNLVAKSGSGKQDVRSRAPVVSKNTERSKRLIPAHIKMPLEALNDPCSLYFSGFPQSYNDLQGSSPVRNFTILDLLANPAVPQQQAAESALADRVIAKFSRLNTDRGWHRWSADTCYRAPHIFPPSFHNGPEIGVSVCLSGEAQRA